MSSRLARSLAVFIAFGALLAPAAAAAEEPFTRLITKNTASYNDDALVLQNGGGVLFSVSEALVPEDDDPTPQRDVYLNKDGVITLLTAGLASSVSLDLVGATDDGSTFYVETTSAALDPADTDGSGTDVYAITNGVADLVSTSLNDPQTSGGISRFEGAAPDGSVVYFRSDMQYALTDQDGGGEDIYAYRPNDPVPDAVQVSTSSSDPQLNTDAEFCGASDSGHVTAFLINSQMVGADTDGTGEDVYWRSAGQTKLASTSPDEAVPQIAGNTECRGVSHDGTAVAFETTIKLDPADDTNQRDVFTYDGVSLRWISTSPLDPATNSTSTFGDMSPDGDTVYFNTGSALLAADGLDADSSDPDGYSVGPPGLGNVLTLITGGTAAAGDTEDGGATIELVSEDGSAVIFSTGDQYVASDDDEESSDLYARFNGGPIKLISTGPTDANSQVNMSLQFDENPPINHRWGVSGDGSIIAYNTSALLTSDDVDAMQDVYAYVIPKPVITPPAPPAPVDSSAPTITSAKLSNKTFAIDKKVKALSVAKSKPKKGTKISFTLSEAASVKLAFQSRTPGRSSGSKCVKETSKNKSAKKCTIIKTVKTAKMNGALGSNSQSFGGKIGSTTLKSGDFQLVITATDAAGNVSATKTLKFSVAKT